MKILYGVQGTGNGHISRARAMARALQQHPELKVQWLFSGRSPDKLFSMEPFGDYWWREGLTFVHRNGKIDAGATTRQLNLSRLLRDIRELPVGDFDLVISDFEPVTAWAAKRRGKQSLGLGHQYAFNFRIPAPRFNWMARGIMRAFAPVHSSLGMHWYHFGHPILPPIAQPHGQADAGSGDHILVYLPFEHHQPLLQELAKVPQKFMLYGAPLDLPTAENIQLKAPSIDGFQQDLASAKAVICNSGFELIAETLTMGKPILTRPLSGQFEQEANAQALRELQLARVVERVDANSINAWLQEQPAGVRIQWPDVAGQIARWIAGGRSQTPSELADSLWDQVVPGRGASGTRVAQAATDQLPPCR
ncbi:MJ1255/VC2487 family glycosyltransferase [Microbulbifer magnicolonia]|uniref:MJ1255/VC2487 family glycosyltransferase n=1 Tax=Microbulbifer magnicolonia TaxID=3109744 RepID=UPI002B406587|nr:MJ1255/VC2487 family glycosyltransferase [Microbulbifer sp. GG15]